MKKILNKRRAKVLAAEENEQARVKRSAVNASLAQSERIQEALCDLWKDYEVGKDASQITQRAVGNLWKRCTTLLGGTSDAVQSEIEEHLKQTMEEVYNAAVGNFDLDDRDEHRQKTKFGRSTSMTYAELVSRFSERPSSTGLNSSGTTGNDIHQND